MNKVDINFTMLKPIIVVLVFLIPSFVPSNIDKGFHIYLLLGGIAQSGANIIILMLIIGGLAQFRNYKLKKITLSDIFNAFMLFLIVLAVYSIFFYAKAIFNNDIIDIEKLPSSKPSFMLAMVSLLFSITVAYSEELLFRVYLISEYELLNFNKKLIAPISGFLFAIGHSYQGIFGVLASAIMGIIFAFNFINHKSWHRIALAHAMYNFFVLLVPMFK